MDDELGIAMIGLDGDWELGTIGEAIRSYAQLYSTACFLVGPTRMKIRPVSKSTGRYSYPWRGGYSSVNFFRSVHAQTPRRYRLRVLQIQYASPGGIELLGSCAAVALVVRTTTYCIRKILDVYKETQKAVSDKKLNQLEVQARQAHTEFIVTAFTDLTHAMKLEPVAIERLHSVTQNDHWARLKIVLAIARRIADVASLSDRQAMSISEAKPLSTINSESLGSEKARKVHEALREPLLQESDVTIDMAGQAEFDYTDDEE